MGARSSAPRSRSQGPGQILVQQHQQRMSRRASELKPRSADLTGRRWSSTAVSVQRNSLGKPKRLAPRQRNLIIKSWNKMAKNKLGKDIFAAIFTEAEELKVMFGINASLKGKKLRTDPKFVAHTDLFIDTFDFVIRNLDDIGMVTENAEQLGKKHASLRMERFKPEHWNIFTECIVENISSQMDKETQIAWRQMVQTLVFYMKLGFERESLRISRTNTGFKRCSVSSSQLKDYPVMLLP